MQEIGNKKQNNEFVESCTNNEVQWNYKMKPYIHKQQKKMQTHNIMKFLWEEFQYK
jgi:hypothetical protein